MTLSASAKATGVTSRAGLVQKIAHGERLRYSFDYRVIRKRAARQSAAAQALLELTTTVWVPIWPMRALTTTLLAGGGTSVSIDYPPTREWFAAGDWVYLYERAQTGTAQFRQIASVSGSVLTLAALGGSLSFPTGTPIAPVRLCVRTRSQIETEDAHDASSIEILSYETI